MFIQVITGKTSDREGLRRQADRWQQEIRPGAAGYLGTTGGVTDDGRFVLLARFESEEAARRNSARDEQGAWWAETEKYLDDVTFQDSVNITTMRGGGSDAALSTVSADVREAVRLLAERMDGVARLVQQRGNDLAELRALLEQMQAAVRGHGDALGGLSSGLTALPAFGSWLTRPMKRARA